MGSPPLGIGTTLAFFHSSGNLLRVREVLIKSVNCSLSATRLSLMTWALIFSIPEDLSKDFDLGHLFKTHFVWLSDSVQTTVYSLATSCKVRCCITHVNKEVINKVRHFIWGDLDFFLFKPDI